MTIQRPARDTPDLVLSDFNMPGGNGWDGFLHLERRQLPFMPGMIMTGSPARYGRTKGMEIAALMERPIDLALMINATRSILSETRREQVRRLADRAFRTDSLTATRVVRGNRPAGWPIA